MILSKVIGTCVSTVKNPVYNGKKVLVLQPINEDLKPIGHAFLSVDSVQAGVGDIVIAAREGNAARQVIGDDKAPIHSIILGIVDQINL